MKEKQDLEALGKVSETYKLADNIYCAGYIDAYDGAKWRVAQVKSFEGQLVDVHYESWGPKYDESKAPIREYKLIPFRLSTTGYTGQVQQAYRDFTYTSEELVKMESKVQRLIETNFESIQTADEITQYIRGSLFFYFDSLLTLQHYFKPTLQNTMEIFGFIDILFELIFKWIQVFPECKEEYKLSRRYKYFYLVNHKAAVANCYRELAEIMQGCFGADKKRLFLTSKVWYDK